VQDLGVCVDTLPVQPVVIFQRKRAMPWCAWPAASRAVEGWIHGVEVQTAFIEPARPWEK
jgi:hypothetical protein